MGTIVVGTDGSDSARRAVEAAYDLACELGDTLVLVTAWRELHGDFGLPLDMLAPSLELRDIEREWAARVLAEFAATVEEAGIKVVTVCKRGDPAAVICDAAGEYGAHLIVVGARGWGRVEGLLFGSVSRGVLSRAPCPVLVIPASFVQHEASTTPLHSSFAWSASSPRETSS